MEVDWSCGHAVPAAAESNYGQFQVVIAYWLKRPLGNKGILALVLSCTCVFDFGKAKKNKKNRPFWQVVQIIKHTSTSLSVALSDMFLHYQERML